MPGVKGRSGRKTGDRERDTQQLWEKSVPIVVGYLSSPMVKQADKVHVALELLKKLIPTPVPALPEDRRPILVVAFGETPPQVTVNPMLSPTMESLADNGRETHS